MLLDDDFLKNLKKAGQFYDKDLCQLIIQPDILAKVPNGMAIQYHMLPIFFDDTKLIIVTDSELAFKSQSQIERQISTPISLMLAEDDNIKMALSKFYNVQNYRQLTAAMNDADVNMDDLTPLNRKITSMLQEAAGIGASDIHILPAKNIIYVYLRINGHLVDYTDHYDFQAAEAINVINLVKQKDRSSNADIQTINMPTSGSFYFTRGTTPIFCRIATVPVGIEPGLQKVNIRLLPQDNKKVKIDAIGYMPSDLATIKSTLFKCSTGLFLNSGPTGAGKTTSLYAQMYYIEDTTGEPLNIMTIDDPIEIREERFTQVQVHETHNEDSNLTPAKILKVGLRSDPDMFLYNEIRDEKDATVALEASTTGHRVFSTVHASDCVKTVVRLMDLNISKVTLLSELKLIISQRLVGLLCPHCSRPHRLTAEERSILSEEEIASLTAPGARLMERGSIDAQKACKHCNQGLEGRTAICEYIVFDNAIRDTLLQQQGFQQVAAVLKSNGFKSMWEKGLAMVKSGHLELKELIRVVGKD